MTHDVTIGYLANPVEICPFFNNHNFKPCGLTKFRLYVYKRRGTNNRFRIPRLTEGRMFHAKMHDEEDDELPRYEEEEGEEGAEQPHEGTLEIEDVVIEEDDDEVVEVGLEDRLHKVHECGWCVSEAKR